MIRKSARIALVLSAVSIASAGSTGSMAVAQNRITTPPSGDNQKASVSQWIGPVRLTIDYSSPDVHGPAGEDRKGKIWGELVPYGMTELGFGCGNQCPWRGGANENTVFSVSHDVKVQGKPLPAGTYGLHFIPGPDEWTVIFSKDSTSWGSYYYDAKEDALRVTARPEKGEYREWLTYELTDRQPAQATVALAWENLKLPVTVSVDDVNDLYVEAQNRELRGRAGFAWQTWVDAAQFCLQNDTHLEEGLRRAEHAVNQGQENFTTLTTLAQLQEANGKTDEAQKTTDRALAHATADASAIHQYARQLQARGKNEEALKVFELNAKKHKGAWPTEVGLARGYAAAGRTKDALEHARIALKQAPDAAAKENVENLIRQWEAAKTK